MRAYIVGSILQFDGPTAAPVLCPSGLGLNQASREDRLAVAEQVIDNAGTRDDLRRRVDEVWTWIQTLPQK